MYLARKTQEANPIHNVGSSLEPIEIKTDMIAKVYNKEDSFQVHFLDENKKDLWFMFKSEKEAKDKANELNFEYYSQNKDKLPKGITVDEENKRFRLFIRLDHRTVKHIKSSKDLSKIIDVRNHILKNLLSLF